LPSIINLFVQNNNHFLYFGTTTEGDTTEGDSTEFWVIRGFNILTGKWLAGQPHVPEIGTDIGSTVYFEIIDGYFYGLLNV
jgi:hypothetical protein